MVIDRDIRRAVSTHFGKDLGRGRELNKWGAMVEQPLVEPEKKNAQYIIREYVNKGNKRKGRGRA